jgi:hypothetical protein
MKYPILQATDSFDDNYFDFNTPAVGAILPGLYAVFIEDEAKVLEFEKFLGADFDNKEAHNKDGKNGVFVRFIPKQHTLDDIKAFYATL